VDHLLGRLVRGALGWVEWLRLALTIDPSYVGEGWPIELGRQVDQFSVSHRQGVGLGAQATLGAVSLGTPDQDAQLAIEWYWRRSEKGPNDCDRADQRESGEAASGSFALFVAIIVGPGYDGRPLVTRRLSCRAARRIRSGLSATPSVRP
jgi:hypothetical protein